MSLHVMLLTVYGNHVRDSSGSNYRNSKFKGPMFCYVNKTQSQNILTQGFSTESSVLSSTCLDILSVPLTRDETRRICVYIYVYKYIYYNVNFYSGWQCVSKPLVWSSRTLHSVDTSYDMTCVSLCKSLYFVKIVMSFKMTLQEVDFSLTQQPSLLGILKKV